MEQPAFVEFIRQFVGSMPMDYRRRYDAEAIVDHARLSDRRGGRRVSVGTFRSSREGMPICIVADDEPGFMSTVAAACVVSRLDVIAAEAYNRVTATGVEAVDLIWVRPAGETEDNVWIAPSDVAGLRSALVVLMDGTFDRRTLVDHVSRGSDPASFGRTRVRVVPGPQGEVVALDVETLDRPGLLFALTDVLFQLHLQIVRSEVRTIAGRVFDRFFFLDENDQPVAEAQAPDICQAVYARLLPKPRASQRRNVRARRLSIRVE